MKVIDKTGEANQFVLQRQHTFRLDRTAALLNQLQMAAQDGDRRPQLMGDICNQALPDGFGAKGTKWVKVIHLVLVVLMYGGIISSVAIRLGLQPKTYVSYEMKYVI